METKECTCECGFKWLHGQSGSHQCEPGYRKIIAELRAALASQAESAPGVAVEVKPFAWFVQPSGFGPYIETGPHVAGAFPAYRANNLLAQRAASVEAKPVPASDSALTDDLIDGACAEITRQDYPQAMEYDRAIAKAVFAEYSRQNPAAGVPHIERDAALREAIQIIEGIDDGFEPAYRACQEAISAAIGAQQGEKG